MLGVLVKASRKLTLLAAAAIGAAVAGTLMWLPGRGFAGSTTSAHRGAPTPDARLQSLEEAIRNSGIQTALTATPNYAGDFVAADSGRYIWVILVTTGPSPDQEALIARFPYAKQVQTRVAQFDMTRLSRLMEAVRDRRDELEAAGVQLVSVGVDIPANRVAVGVSANAAAASRVLAERFPIDMLKVTVVSQPVPILRPSA